MLCTLCPSRGICSPPKEYYEFYSMLEHALISGSNNFSVPNIKVIADAFFPKRKSEPICVPIKYLFLCNNSKVDGSEDEYLINCSLDYSPKFLWTQHDVSDNVGALLFSYYQNGIALKGFEWEKSCLVEKSTEIVLQVTTLDYEESLLEECMLDLTSQV